MAIAYLLTGWHIEPWLDAMRTLDPAMDVRFHPQSMGKPDDIRYAVAWLPPPNVLRTLPNLKVIFSLGAGVDAILSDPTLPRLPIVRVVEPDLTMRMTEHVTMHVLMHHRQQRRIEENQRRKVWDSFPTHAASALQVGIMGFGVLGQDCARALKALGFNVTGWSRTPKPVPGIRSYGERELDQFLAGTDILVVLMPLTDDTRGMVDRALIRKLSKRGPFGAPILINAGRGGLHVEADVIDCLKSGDLYAASLDVFEKEPLPASSPLWELPNVYVTPHLAADSDALTITRYLLKQIKSFEAGQPLENLVDTTRGY
jgi:glyoxylate/hydroxypyruvate reductase